MDFILPEVWYLISTTKEENTIITNWINSELIKLNKAKIHDNYLGKGVDIFNSNLLAGSISGTQITFEQFTDYVLNSRENTKQEIDTDLSSLKLLLENIYINNEEFFIKR